MRNVMVAMLLATGPIVGAVPARAEPIRIATVTPYADESRIPTNILTTCKDLGATLSRFTKEFAEEQGLQLVREATADPSKGGRVFVIEITNAMSMGNAWFGHRKLVSARGELFVDGAARGATNAMRDSMGGFGGGFKGSCSVLGRTAKAVGKDLAAWLADHQ